VSDKENSDQDGVYLIDLEKGSKKTIVAGLGNYKNLVFDEPGRRLSFITDRDDYESKSPNWSLYLWYRGSSKATAIAAEGDSGIPEQWWISSNAAPFFSESGKYLFYYTAPKPEVEKEAEESDDNEPEAKLDLWHWQDPLLQPQQLLQAEQEKKRSYIASYNLMTRKRVQIATLEIPDVVIDAKRKSDLTLGITDRPYRKSISWDLPGYRDVYLMNLRTGESRELLTKVRSRPQLSPTGKFLMWWDTESRNWFGQSTKSDSKPINLTSSIDYPLFNELHDTPSDPRPYGVAGWTQGDRSVWIYDRYDIWEIDPTGEQLPKRVTEGLGRQAKLQFRYRRLDFEQRQIPAGKILLSAFNETNKDSGYYQLDRSVGGNEGGDQTSKLSTAILLPESIGGIQKARNSDEVILTRSTFRRYPDIWTTTLEFKKLKRLSEANPQQDDYLWGTAELTRWKAGDGQELEGLIYKPDFFDPSKKYPLMVYFYERNSDNLHRHYVPAAGRSIINFSFYASRGYIIFVPDIPYKTGEPGPSASNAVLPGVEHMVKMGFIDEEKIGMQGHSWGGYQTAYLVTQTNRFACAESGAPVSNMTSAYGGIRWGSGMSRMFQYEKTQSRIGDTLWNARDKYIANSPLFFADRIETPLLILHNDEDGAVPWYQGIELFVAMRRLEKPAWLLNYNGDPHWVMGRANRLDFAKRMQQFFDHYLLEGPLPRWMAEGIPAVDKGKDFGFEEMASETESVEEAAESESTNE
ncbi:MAG: prolyl oligopeptidase family serine peptidase, partial [Planctomycetota bacterium]